MNMNMNDDHRRPPFVRINAIARAVGNPPWAD